LISIAFLTVSVIAVSAKNANANNNNGKGKTVSSTVQTVTQLESKVRNPKAKEALQIAAETTEQVEATAESALNEMYGRPGFLKFIIGPDYKNAGEVRSEIVKLRNEIRKLTKTGEGLTGSDKTAIDQSIAALQTDLVAIETKLSDALKGISLFGWLSKLLNGFTAPEASPTPTVSPSASPSASPTAVPSASPSAAPTASATPAV